MITNIIHNPLRKDRRFSLMKEAETQGFTYMLWGSVNSLTPQRGCHLAHRRVIQAAHNFGWPFTVIMEDDVMFTAPGAWKFFLQQLPDDFDIYTAGSYGQTVKYNTDNGTIKQMSGTHCYIVHSRFYDQYLNMVADEHLDQQISKYAPVIKMCYPMCALQHSGHSDIIGEHTDYNQEKWIQYPLYEVERGITITTLMT